MVRHPVSRSTNPCSSCAQPFELSYVEKGTRGAVFFFSGILDVSKMLKALG